MLILTQLKVKQINKFNEGGAGWNKCLRECMLTSR